MDIVILCGGLGTRLKSVTGDAPKVMAEVDGKPFLDVIIEYLKDQGFQRIILCTGYQAQTVERYYQENSHDMRIVFSREEEPLGTGGALKNTRSLIESDIFFVMNGDSFCPINLKNFLGFYEKQKTIAALAVSKVDESKDYGGIVLDKEYRILGFYEKADVPVGSTAGYVNAGIYCFNKKLFSLMPEMKKFSMEYDVFPKLIQENIYGFLIDEKFFDIGTPERLKKIREEKL